MTRKRIKQIKQRELIKYTCKHCPEYRRYLNAQKEAWRKEKWKNDPVFRKKRNEDKVRHMKKVRNTNYDAYIKKKRLRDAKYRSWYKDYELSEEGVARRKRYNAKEENKKRRCAALRLRYANDPTYNLMCRLRARFSHFMRNVLRGKRSGASKTKEFLGCSPDEFLEYMRGKYVDGMSDQLLLNGEIAVDHIVPLAAYDLTCEDAARRAFHYTNLQPLWFMDNCRKSSRYNGVLQRFEKSREARAAGVLIISERKALEMADS